MKILLTGGSGFVGRHILESLGAGHSITAPSHSELDVTNDVAVDEALAHGRFDAVIHAAVQGGARVLDSTLRGYWNLTRNERRVHRIIYFGSGAEYGKHRDLVKIREASVGDETPRDDYGFAKLLCNEMCRRSENIINLRLFGIYGPHEGYMAKFISNAVAKSLVGLPLTIRQDVIFDYLWVDDLIRLLPIFLERERIYADINVTPTESVSLAAIAAYVLAETGQSRPIEFENPGLNYQYSGDNARLLRCAPAFAFTSISDGIRLLVAHYRARVDTIDVEALTADDYRRRCATRAEPAHAKEPGH